MRKYILRIFTIICLLGIILSNLLFVNAEPTESEETSSDSSASEVTEDTESSTDTGLSEEDFVNPEESENSEESTDDIYTEETEEQIGQVQPSSTDNMDITSVRNINGLPEANLELNNILNIILIAIGVLLILLAIALLIRLKK